MGAAVYRGKGFKERAGVSGERPIGTASCRQQHNQVSCQPPTPLPIMCGQDAQNSKRYSNMPNTKGPELH